MKQEIIDKYGLIKTVIQNGNSFVNNTITYQHPRTDIEVYFIDGDLNGELLKDGFITIYCIDKRYIKYRWCSFVVPDKLLLDEISEKYIEDEINHNLKNI